MITVQKDFSLPETYPLTRIALPEEILFFDIETTGFSGDYAQLYLIGCTHYSGGSWHLIQWFADTKDAEKELLHAFFSYLNNYRYLIHFNGDGFDIPFLLKRCAAHGLSYHFDNITSIDIYRKIKPYRKLLQLDSMRQKSIEAFLHLSREDKYSGGQLIEVYEDYLTSHDDFLYRLLMLHNEDDLKGMPAILPILHYPDFLNGTFTFCRQTMRELRDIFGQTEQQLVLTYESPVTLPVSAELEAEPFDITLSGRQLTITVPLLEGELKHFYEDYQNYVYLIYEDNAIHKSVGQYVDKSAKKKATARTCYTRTSGLFLPQPSKLWTPVLKEDYKSKQLYTLYKESLFEDSSCAEAYRKEVLELCL